MKIRIINPDYGVTQEEKEQRCRILQDYVGPDTELSMVSPVRTKVEIDSQTDVVMAAPELLELAHQAVQDGCDAVVMYCFSDPAIAACRETVPVPVVGGAQASLLLVPQIARHVHVVLADASRIPEKEVWLRTLGLSPDRIRKVTAIDFGHKSIWDNREEAFQQLLETGRKLMAEEQAECLILGCLSFLGMAPRLSQLLGIPVIDAAVAAVSAAESLVRQKLKTSRVSYCEWKK
jgi:allantoin racemase